MLLHEVQKIEWADRRRKNWQANLCRNYPQQKVETLRENFAKPPVVEVVHHVSESMCHVRFCLDVLSLYLKIRRNGKRITQAKPNLPCKIPQGLCSVFQIRRTPNTVDTRDQCDFSLLLKRFA